MFMAQMLLFYLNTGKRGLDRGKGRKALLPLLTKDIRGSRKMRQKEENQLQRVSFRKLVVQALPEMWSFQFLVLVILAFPTTLLIRFINTVAGAGGGVITTANLRAFLFSWKAPVILALGFLLVLVYVVMEIFAEIHMCDDILNGRKVSVLQEIKKGIRSLRLFFNPTGILVLIYIFIAVPLCGVGFSISLTEHFYIPNFIMDVIWAKPLYTIGYLAGILFLAWFGYRSVFVLHEVLIDGKSPKEGRKASVAIIKAHKKEIIFSIIKFGLVVALIYVAAFILLRSLPGIWLESLGKDVPKVPVSDLFLEERFDDAAMMIVYRIMCAFTVLMGAYLVSIIMLLCSAYFILRFTRMYFKYSAGEPEDWLERPKKALYRRRVMGMIAVTAFVALLSVAAGLQFEQVFLREEPVKIIAHRAGGSLASENSLEGLEVAIEHGCYASEIDIHRTKDGYYVINHDDTFQRLTGVAKAPQDMTLEEIRQLRIKDTTGSGALLPVVTLEEMLDVIKGKEKLFIEMKGATADEQMVDDVVRMVREKGCEEDAVLISLQYKVIDYAETKYPEFETGTLFFAGIGDVTRLNCDLLIMEEEFASDERILQVHNAGKQAIVWTVNHEAGMYRFLDSQVDGVITDEIELAEKVQKRLDERTDLKIMQDKISGIY